MDELNNNYEGKVNKAMDLMTAEVVENAGLHPVVKVALGILAVGAVFALGKGAQTLIEINREKKAFHPANAEAEEATEADFEAEENV